MRILIAHNHYQVKAGEDVVVEAEMSLLQSHDHAIALLDADNLSIKGAIGKAKAALSVIYSLSSKQRLQEKIQQFRPDVVHVHNFFPLLSPSLYDACSEAKVPVVQTLHNYRITCPSANLFRDGKICETCRGKTVPLAGIVQRCYRGSLPESIAIAAMITTHNLRHTWQEKVDAYITLTSFQKAKMEQIGLPSHKIHVKPNFLFDPLILPPAPADPYALYVGRLWSEKGITTLIDAYIIQDIKIPLKIVGDGILQDSLQRQVQRAGLSQRIEFLGWQKKPEVLALMQKAQFLIFPSVWYETFGLSMIESFACSVPVIASRLGGMAEIVEDRQTGLLFEAGNPQDLAEKINWAIANPERMLTMGRNARSTYEQHYTPETNYRQLMSIYEKVIRH
ncbi:MAG: glycosyltransferase family 4 protein [Leptolyngbyaceae cyanobacterium CSU_1_4]|nr:glycosyltransferase family 4 protein [Leptolyngbyaceae cyanobacterium CSU_1_4]